MATGCMPRASRRDRKSTRLNSSHSQISYAVFCLKNNFTASKNSRRRFYRQYRLQRLSRSKTCHLLLHAILRNSQYCAHFSGCAPCCRIMRLLRCHDSVPGGGTPLSPTPSPRCPAPFPNLIFDRPISAAPDHSNRRFLVVTSNIATSDSLI